MSGAGAQPEHEFKTWPPLSDLDEYRRELRRAHRAGEHIEFESRRVHVDQTLATFEA